jgi:molybdopterin synthase sulfur carrier subunit
MATVQLPISLRTLFSDVPKRTTVDAATVAEVIDRLDERWPGMRNRLCQSGPVLREFINVFVDGERADLSTPVAARSLVHILPAMAGGCGARSLDAATHPDG